jgi:hypothetical protein
MTNEEAIKAEMRLVALESFVTVLWGWKHLEAATPKASLEELRKVMIQKAREKTFQGVGAVYSDAASAELEAAVDSLLKAQETLLRPRL